MEVHSPYFGVGAEQRTVEGKALGRTSYLRQSLLMKGQIELNFTGEDSSKGDQCPY